MFLYHWYEWQRAMLAPLRLGAEVTQATFRHPLLPAAYSQFGRAVAAGAELVERTTRQFGKPEFGLLHTEIDGSKIPVHEEIVAQLPFCNLIRFVRTGAPTDQPRMLVVAPMSGHHATLLRGTIETLLPAHDVYVTDWLDARMIPMARGGFNLDDYAAYVIDFVRLLGPDVHLLAVCQPSVPVLMAVAVMAANNDPAQPRSMTLMGGPIDARAAQTAVTKLATQHPIEWFERTVVTDVPFYYPGAFRRVCPGFIQLSGFMSMNLDRHVGEHLKLFQHLVRGDGESAEGHRKFYNEYLSVMDVTAEFYLQTVERVFQKFELPQGTMRWRGQPVRADAIRQTALLTIEGARDDISAPGQTLAAQDICSGLPDTKREHFLHPTVGHYGIFNGRRWREDIYPRVHNFVRRHSRSGDSKPLKVITG